MAVITGLSGNEIYCLAQKGYHPGNIVVGNSVHSLGLLRSIGTGFKTLLGGELEQVTALIAEGRETAFKRMVTEGANHQASGITGVSSELIFHGTNIEFLALGSVIHATQPTEALPFTSNSDGQELYAQIDAGYQPLGFAFGNVVYSMGIARGFLGNLKTLARGEIKEFSDIFNHTRHLALERIIAHAKTQNANAVLGIRTSIISLSGVNEMLMIGTASHHPNLPPELANEVITSDMTNVEMWNMASLGFVPMRLLLGTSVYSLGLAGRITSTLKSFVRGEINELTQMIYEAREQALGIINNEAKAIGADDVVGVNTYVYQLGNGLIEFLAIGTAVKKIPNMPPQSAQLPPQALVVDKASFYDSSNADTYSISANAGSRSVVRGSGFLWVFSVLVLIAFAILGKFIK